MVKGTVKHAVSTDAVEGKKKLEQLTFPVKSPPAKDEKAAVPMPYFAYSGLQII